jgi:hypothetical protein
MNLAMVKSPGKPHNRMIFAITSVQTVMIIDIAITFIMVPIKDALVGSFALALPCAVGNVGVDVSIAGKRDPGYLRVPWMLDLALGAYDIFTNDNNKQSTCLHVLSSLFSTWFNKRYQEC